MRSTIDIIGNTLAPLSSPRKRGERGGEIVFPRKIRTSLWLIPCLYGILVMIAAGRWLIAGMPCGHRTYENILHIPWSAFIASLSPEALVRL